MALVGVQTHQFHTALDLAAYARRNGCMAVIGGPHVMTCDTSQLHDRGVSFAPAEAELVWPEILRDAARGELRSASGQEQRWQQELEAPVIVPPQRRDLSRYRARRHTHPMSGGVIRVRRDGVNDFIALRKETFGFERAPLPRSLELFATDHGLNGVKRPRAGEPDPGR